MNSPLNVSLNKLFVLEFNETWGSYKFNILSLQLLHLFVSYNLVKQNQDEGAWFNIWSLQMLNLFVAYNLVKQNTYHQDEAVWLVAHHPYMQYIYIISIANSRHKS